MDIQQVKNFILLSQYKNFSKAAKELYISQPALTKQLKNIEKELGCALFLRESSGLSLTKEGEIFLDYANKVVSLTETMEEKIQHELLDVYSHLTIGHSTQYHLQLIEKAIPELFSIKDNLDISVKQLMPQHQLELIKKEELSCGFMHLPSVKEEKEIEYVTLLKGGAVIHISDSDPLSSQQELSIEQLKNHTLIINKQSDQKYIEYILTPYKEAGIKPKIKEVDGKTNVLLTSGIGNFISITSCYATSQSFGKLIPLKELSDGCDIVLVYKKGNKNPYIQKLISIIQKSL